VTAVVELEADEMVAVEGPLVCFQTPADRVVPVAGVDTLVRVTELVGSLMVCAALMLTVGVVLAEATLAGEVLFTTADVDGVPVTAALTVTVTVEEAD
jgi:hypothetical protein